MFNIEETVRVRVQCISFHNEIQFTAGSNITDYTAYAKIIGKSDNRYILLVTPVLGVISWKIKDGHCSVYNINTSYIGCDGWLTYEEFISKAIKQKCRKCNRCNSTILVKK